MNEPKITVVIPTRERSDVLKESLRTVTAQDYSNLDIIVSDNFGADDTEDVVRSANDSRIRYINTGKRLSMSRNWEFALSNVDDEGWVTIIGDDDGLLPGSLSTVAEIIQLTGVLAIRSSACAYRWPSPTNLHPVVLEVPLGSGFELRQTRQWLAKVLSGKAAYWQLPMLYNGGFVSMSVLKAIKSKSGSFYKSSCPDIYSAVALSSMLDRYVFSWEPLAISGSSRHSTGQSHFEKAKDSNSKETPADKFAAEQNLPFHRDLPLDKNGRVAKSLQLAVYESYLQSSCLRPTTDATSHAEQLEIILATSGMHISEISEWGKEFAKTHDLDYAKIRSKARLKRPVLQTAAITRKAFLAMNTYFVRPAEVPLKNVFDASKMAAEIRADIPGLTKRFFRLSRQALQLGWEKVSGLRTD